MKAAGLAYGLIFGIAQALFLVPVVPAAAGWFRRYLGLGMGIMMISWSIGPAIVVQLMALMFDRLGWTSTLIITGIAGSALMGFLYDRSLLGLVVFSVIAQLAAVPFLLSLSKQRPLAKL